MDSKETSEISHSLEKICSEKGVDSISLVEEQGEFFIFKCPHCMLLIEVHKTQVNCKIFRHASYFEVTGEDSNGTMHIQIKDQINPHTSKSECERLVREGKVVGCGKPFQLFVSGNIKYAIPCGYI